MASWNDVRQLVARLPEVSEREAHGGPAWCVRRRDFVWERPLRSADNEALGARAVAEPVLGAYVEDLGAKEALLGDKSTVYFTTPHFDGYPVVLVQLPLIEPSDLEELITEAWLARAPMRLRKEYLRASWRTDEDNE